METLPETIKSKSPASIGASLFLDVARFEHAQRVAKMLATSTMIPEHFRNNVGNCVIALNLAERFMADPFMVMQNVYVVHGRPGLEGKLVIALINQCGKFSPLQYKFEKQNGKPVSCTAYATHKETDELLEQTVTWDMVVAEGWNKKPGSKWLTMPEIMFQYRSAAFFARVYCPEVILGMQTVEEIFDFVTMKKTANGSYTPADVEPETYDTTEFDNQVKAIIDYPPDATLDKFIKLTAQAQAVPVDRLKFEAGKQFDDFWKAFEAWRVREYPDKTPPPDTTETPNPWDKDQWWNMRSGSPEKGTGFAAYCQKHKDAFFNAPLDIQGAAGAKWASLYPDVPFPFAEKSEPPEETTPDDEPPPYNTTRAHVDQKTNGLYLDCPDNRRKIHTAICANSCTVKEKCQTYQETLF